MSVLICKNVSTEGPGTIEDYLRLKKVPYSIVDLAAGETIADASGFDTLVILGGPMSVNDDIAYVRAEEQLVRAFIAAGKKVLGICLGAQLMAKALGGKVYKGPWPEIGWLDIQLTSDGLNDPLMQELSGIRERDAATGALKVFQWHGETFDIPEGATKLASSARCPNQAFRVSGGYAFQFHMEVTRVMIDEWMSSENIDKDMLALDTNRLYEDYKDRAYAFYRHFFN
jgi:GMP synthase (glutamine-hydrolysing)